MRKIAASTLIALGAVGVSVSAASSAGAASVGTVPPDTIADEPAVTEPAPLDSTATVELAPGTEPGDSAATASPTGFEPVVVVDRNGAELAAMTVVT